MSFSHISRWIGIILLIPPLAPISLAIPKMGTGPQLNTKVRTTTIISSSTTTFLAISTEYSTPAGDPATSAMPPLTGLPWATKPWFPPTYTWKESETSGTTSSTASSFYPTPANMSNRYSTLTGRPPATQLPSPQKRGREIHPSWNPRWCLAVRTKIFADGTPVEIGRCTKSLGEYWEFKRSPGRTRIRVAGTNFCLKGGIGECIRKTPTMWLVWSQTSQTLPDCQNASGDIIPSRCHNIFTSHNVILIS